MGTMSVERIGEIVIGVLVAYGIVRLLMLL